ncbi:hypothetical protein A9Q99_25245 [Gammaproteobacteria bacterium 45_16_T64]|nr:hypothetical protein A9Q99_25245 [Gammaproteobacteria bacterium 45_16_T64]
MMVFMEVILLMIIIPTGLFFLLRKKDPKDAQQEANKILGNAVTATDYCTSKGISEADLQALIGANKIRAYETMGMLFVEDKSMS